jgi:hypothetical protein
METPGHVPLDESTLWVPVTEQDKKLVRRQMERLLETNHFRNSRRYPALFRFIVEETLEGRGEFLKERLLGIQVFGRPTDYDTAADPVVRVTVAEIRKRIAQYYHDRGHEAELRIELLTGRYEPEFRLVRDSRQPATEGHGSAWLPDVLHDTEVHTQVVPFPVPTVLVTPAEHVRRKRWFVGAGLIVALVVVGILAWPILHPDALEQFWAPVLKTHQAVILCIPVAGGKYGVAATSKILLPEQENAKSASGPPKIGSGTYLALESLGENVVFSDVRAMMDISDVLSEHHVSQHVRLNTAVTLDDLRQGPAILVGGMDNQWTLRTINRLRYGFGGNDQEIYWVADTQTGKPTPWSLDLKTPITAVNHDYAIIARVHAEDTGQTEVIVAGIGMSGTAAAGELLANPAELVELRRRVGAGFKIRDFEAVISTDVVNGIAGSPKILTVDVH